MRDMTTDGGAWLGLAQRVVEERAAHGWTQADVADRGGFSVDRLQEIEKGQRTTYRATTLGALERGLYWRRGSVRRVLDGDEPIVEEDVGDEIDLPSQTSSADAIVADTAQAIRDDPTLIDEAKQHLLNQYDLLRRLSPPELSARRGSQESRRAANPPDDDQRLRAVARGGDPKDRAEVRRLARRAREQHERDSDDTGKK